MSSWLQPQWPTHPQVRSVFTTRDGGHSQPPYGSLNLGDHVGDDPAAVQANRQTLARTLAAHPVFLQQVHGWNVVTLQADTPDGLVADACITATPGVVCTAMVADCLPVLLTHKRGGVVAAAHAGWRGLLGWDGFGVLEAVFSAFCHFPDAQWAGNAPDQIAQDLQVWLGPCIGPQAFEVGPEVREAFSSTYPLGVDPAQVLACFTPSVGDRYWADLPQLARLRWRALGVSALYGNDGSPEWCTVSRESLFFSHRRDSRSLGSTGRQAAGIWLD